MNRLIVNKWKYALAVSLLLILGFSVNVIATVPDQEEAQNILDKYCDLINSGDVDAMMNYVVDMRQTPEETKELYRSLVKDDSEVPRSIELNKVSRQLTKNGLSIVADTTITFKDGHSRSQTLYFKKFQDQWKIFVPRQGEASTMDL